MLALALSAAGPTVASADETFMSHPIDNTLKALDLKADPGVPADFVKQSRPQTEGDFVPVGEPHPTRPVKLKTPAELKAAEADLDAARIRHDKLSGRKPPVPKTAKKPEANAAEGRAPATQN